MFYLLISSYGYLYFIVDCLYICTEDAFPSQRLVQMERYVKRKNFDIAARHRFTDNVFIEHLSDKVWLILIGVSKCSVFVVQCLWGMIRISHNATDSQCDTRTQATLSKQVVGCAVYT